MKQWVGFSVHSRSSDYRSMYTTGLGNLSFGLRALGNNQQLVADSLERLATGKQINRASDDPSGMIASEQHKVRIYSIESQLKAFAQQEGYLGAKEGGLSVVSEQLIELNGLIVQAANTGANSEEEQGALKLEIDSLLGSINTIASTSTYKGQQILNEYTTSGIANNTVLTDADGNDVSLADLSGLVFSDPKLAQELAQAAVDDIASTRGAIGNQLNDIESQSRVLEEELINLSDSLSSIEDVDYAKEASKLVRAQILESASIKAIEISRQSASQVLSLLESATELVK